MKVKVGDLSVNALDVNIFDSFSESSLNYISKKQENIDKSVDGTPISNEIIKNSKTKGIIGKIGGIGADSNEPTRNGRRYPIELWENVEKSDYFIEGMENRTLIGEADHPQERLDYSVTEGAVVLTKYEIQNDGRVYTEFDILDTIPGRTVKTYFDAGCKLGVSSRGLGEEVMRNGEKIIDPDTYQFYCFDVVAFPAVKTARMELLESTSPKKQTLINSITSEINKCQSLDEVLFIESMSQGVNLYLDEIKEAIENKKSELIESSNDDTRELAKLLVDKLNKNENKTKEDSLLSDYLKEWLGESIESLFNQLKEEVDENNKIQISKSDVISNEDTLEKINDEDVNIDSNRKLLFSNSNLYSEEISSLENELDLKNSVIQQLLIKNIADKNALNDKCEVIKNLVSKNVNVESENSNLKEQLNEKIAKLESLNSKYSNLQIANEHFSKIIDAYNSKYCDLNTKYNSIKEACKVIKNNESSLQDENYKLQESINNVNKNSDDKMQQLTEANNVINKLSNDNTLLHESIVELTNKHNASLKECNALKESMINCLDKYIEAKCSQYNLDKSVVSRLCGENYDIKKIDDVVNKLVENNYKLSLLPYNSLVTDKQVYVENIGLKESVNSEVVTEDLDMFNMMISSKNN